MRRRDWLRATAGSGLAAWLMRPGLAQDSDATSPPQSGGPRLTIRDVRAIVTSPGGLNLVVVKIETDEPELYGLGCATFSQRTDVVVTAIEKYLKPFLIGKDPLEIEDIWRSSYVSSYWRNGPVLNNALSGVDMACWDILGKVAGLPLYQILGGRVRETVATYEHVSGHNIAGVVKNVQRTMENGYRYIRCHVGIPGNSVYGFGSRAVNRDAPPNQQVRVYDPTEYARTIPKLFDAIREAVGDKVELLHDVHERLPPITAIGLAKDLEPYHLFFLEEPLSPEDTGYMAKLREQTSTPIAAGELFNNPNEFVPLIKDRLIDFVRCHLSQIGGLTPARKLAHFCEFFEVRTAWHGPGDVSPVGHAVNVHLDLAAPNFGVQEAQGLGSKLREVFPGTPEVRDGNVFINEAPGHGVTIDEQAAARFPPKSDPPFFYGWGNYRLRDGTVVKP